jgi:hypothetical protein
VFRDRRGKFCRVPRCGKDLTGRPFGRLSVVRSCGSENGDQIWLLRCSCGSGKRVYSKTSSLTDGHPESCGCLNREHLDRVHKKNTQHGHALGNGRKSRTSAIWEAMLRRCHPNPISKPHHWENYGGANPPVRVCKRWHKFVNFLADLGEVPTGKSLSRKMDIGNYRPGNATWATRAEQQIEAAKKRRKRGNH